MPIGVPRIIYCWGEELPAQWTDIYNFIFRRRMVFLMQYLDDELCNQICGLLINIHMEDRSKELEKKEMERSGVFKSSNTLGQSTAALSSQGAGQNSNKGNMQQLQKQSTSFFNKKSRSMEDLLNADEDLGIDEIDTLEQYTLQKITTEWLNWNAQFFDYSDEPYLFYLAELLSKDFNKAQNSQKVNRNKKNVTFAGAKAMLAQEDSPSFANISSFDNQRLSNNSHASHVKQAEELSLNFHSKLLNMLKTKKEAFSSSLKSQNALAQKAETNFASSNKNEQNIKNSSNQTSFGNSKGTLLNESLTSFTNKAKIQMGQVYSPFRTNVNLFNSFTGLVKNKSAVSSEQEKEKQITNNQVANKDSLIKNYSVFFENISLKKNKQKLLQMFQQYKNSGSCTTIEGNKQTKVNLTTSVETNKNFLFKGTFSYGTQEKTIYNLLSNLAQQKFTSKLKHTNNFTESTEKILGQRNLRREYNLEKNFTSLCLNPTLSSVGLSQSNKQGSLKSSFSYGKKNMKSFNYLNTSMAAGSTGSYEAQQGEFRDYYRKQTERALIEEESKKVFVIINSFGGSVGNGITVHDALQFIKAGSLTLALGVAASAASLALAGGTIGERYVTEGCHVMIHQPESSLQGQASDIWIDSQEIMKIRLDVAEIYSLATYRPRHKILRDLDRDFYLSATETIQYGLADEIATNEVMNSILEEVNTAWDYESSKQERLLDSRARNLGDNAQAQAGT